MPLPEPIRRTIPKTSKLLVIYEEESTSLFQRCENCEHFIEKNYHGTSSCDVVRGEINPEGRCFLWIPKIPR